MLRCAVIAHPAAHADRVELLEDRATLGVWVRARAIEGKANTAIEAAIARALGVRPRQVRVVVGTTSRRKIVEIDLPNRAVLDQRLTARAVPLE
jgi:uncharacterized protein YggU (UPF0235/DUF167 family)